MSETSSSVVFSCPPAGMRIKQAAPYIGVSVATFERLRSAGKLPPSLKIGDCVVYRRADLDRFLALGAPDAKTFAELTAS